ncbi:MAG TPA: hypothetical protein VGG28_14860, partial [Kofleriaceae bacterium]
MKLFALAVIVSACSLSVDYTGTLFQCGTDGPCPSDYSCVGGYCLPDTAMGTTCAMSVGLGAEHSCAVRDDGTVWCWGANDSGQVGDGTADDALVPTQVMTVTGATVVVGGGSHTCAIGSAGVQCWGKNGNGQLGDGTMTDARMPVTAMITGATALAAGDSFTCAIVGG